METQQQCMLSYLEEDNVQRSYFRVRFLMTRLEPMLEEDYRRYPDRGCLRIVPDKQEHATFKDRMRSLGSLCVVDLTPYPLETNKVRNNKNYSPEAGEENQFVIYSDAVHAIPENTVFEVFQSVEELSSHTPVTKQVLFRKDEAICGPMEKDADMSAAPVCPVNPDYLHRCTFPDGSEHLFYISGELTGWLPYAPAPELRKSPARPAAAPAPVPAPAAQPTPAAEEPANRFTTEFDEKLKEIDSQPLSPEANRLKAVPMEPIAPPIPDKELTGVPLYSTSSTRYPQPTRARATLSGVVDAQLRGPRPIEIGATLPQGAKMQDTANPMEALRDQLNRAWADEDLRHQVAQIVLQLDGAPSLLEKAMNAHLDDSPLTLGARRLLESLEADRLSLLVQLDHAKEKMAEFRTEAIDSAHSEAKKLLDEKREQLDDLKSALQEVKKQLKNAVDERNRAIPHTVLGHNSVSVNAVTGEELPEAEILTRLQSAFRQAGFTLTTADAVHIAILLGMGGRFGLVDANTGDTAAVAKVISAALGVDFLLQEEERETVSVANVPADAAPVLVASPFLNNVSDGAMRLMLLLPAADTLTGSLSYQMNPWGVVYLNSLCPGDDPTMAADMAETAVSLKSLDTFGEGNLLNEEAETWLRGIIRELQSNGVRISLVQGARMRQYLAAACRRMPGGFPQAADFLAESWLLPIIGKNAKARKVLADAADLLPRTAARLNA